MNALCSSELRGMSMKGQISVSKSLHTHLSINNGITTENKHIAGKKQNPWTSCSRCNRKILLDPHDSSHSSEWSFSSSKTVTRKIMIEHFLCGCKPKTSHSRPYRDTKLRNPCTFSLNTLIHSPFLLSSWELCVI